MRHSTIGPAEERGRAGEGPAVSWMMAAFSTGPMLPDASTIPNLARALFYISIFAGRECEGRRWVKFESSNGSSWWREDWRRHSAEEVAAGFEGALAHDEAGFEEGAKEVHGALLGDSQSGPEVGGPHTAALAEEIEELLLPGPENEFLAPGFGGEVLNAFPDALQGDGEPFGGVLEPGGEVVARGASGLKSGVVARAVFPVVLVNGEDVVRIEAAAVELPVREGAARAPVAIGEGVSALEPMIQPTFGAHEERPPFSALFNQ